MDREHRVRERAYAIWEADGRPSGRDEDHWDRASREVDQELSPALADDPRPDDAAAQLPVAEAEVAPASDPAPAPRARRAPKPKGASVEPVKPAKPRATKARSGKAPK